MKVQEFLELDDAKKSDFVAEKIMGWSLTTIPGIPGFGYVPDKKFIENNPEILSEFVRDNHKGGYDYFLAIAPHSFYIDTPECMMMVIEKITKKNTEDCGYSWIIEPSKNHCVARVIEYSKHSDNVYEYEHTSTPLAVAIAACLALGVLEG